MNQEIMLVLGQLQREKGIDQEVLIDAVKSAVVSASRKYYGPTAEIEAVFDSTTGSMDLFCHKVVVDEVIDPDMEISLEEATAYLEKPAIGDAVDIRIPYEEFGRIAAQTAKQVILQRVREGEREMIYEEYKDREGELINGTVSRVEKGTIYVDMGKGEGVLPRREQVFREVYRRSDRIRAYLLEVRQAARGPQIILSRTNPGLVIRLFEIEVPEIYEGIVEIKTAVREPSGRTKLAVVSHDRDVDPVGACVGMRGSRVQAIVQELRGEKIDIIPWSEDIQTLASNSLSPAKIARIILEEAEHSMTVVAPDDQLSLAIGKGGQNVRLAAKLLKWRIDIKGETEYQAEQLVKADLVLSGVGSDRSVTPLTDLEGLGPRTAGLLEEHGIKNIEQLKETSPEKMVEIPGIGLKNAEALIARSHAYMKEHGQQEIEEDVASEGMFSLTNLEGLGPKTADLLQEYGIKNIERLKETSPEKMVEIPGIGLKNAEALIARAHAYVEEHGQQEVEEDETSEEASVDETAISEEIVLEAGATEGVSLLEDKPQEEEHPVQPDTKVNGGG